MTDETFRPTSLNDRATVAANAVLEIVAAAETEPNLAPGELQRRVWQRLREELDDIARLMATEQCEYDTRTYDMGPVTDGPSLHGMKFDDAVDAVVEWFFANFEDPAESTPYESAEGGYQFIWGGPYDAREQIDDAFWPAISEAVVDAAVKRIDHAGLEWAPSQSRMVEADDIPGAA